MDDTPLSVGDAKAARNALEGQILTLIKEFEKTTALSVERVELVRYRRIGSRATRVDGVTVEVGL